MVPWHIWAREKRKGALEGLLKSRRLANPHSRAKRLLVLDDLSCKSALKSTQGSHEAKEPQRRCDLDPATWQGLPYDIIFNIINHLDVSNQITWSSVARDFFPYASSKIWAKLRISSADLEAYADRGTIHELLPSKAHFILFLVNRAFRTNPSLLFNGLRTLDDPLHMYRPAATDNKFINIAQLPAPLPGHYVRSLTFGPFRGSRLKAPTSTVLYALSKNLPNVEECVVEGRLYTYFFAHVLDFKTLTRLDIRADPRDEIVDNLATNPISFLVMDFGRLVTLERLTSLKIGCLLLQEAKTLAESVSILKLKTLEISCSRTGYDDDQRGWIYQPKTAKSPLIRFLVEIQYSTSGTKTSEIRGFPRTLEKLLLRDDWHHNIQNLHQNISAAIVPCEDLKTLTVSSLTDSRPARHLRYLPFYGGGMSLGLETWQQLTCPALGGLVHESCASAGNERGTGVLPHSEKSIKIYGSLVKLLDHYLPGPSTEDPISDTIRFTKVDQVPKRNTVVVLRRK